MKRLLLALLTALPLAAVPLTATADPGPTPDAAAGGGWQQHAREGRSRHMAEALGLNEADALKLDQTVKGFDAQRLPLMQQAREARQLLKRAAGGDAQVAGQVDAAVQSLFQARERLSALKREMFTTLSGTLAPPQRAKLALVLQKDGRHPGRGAGRHGGNRY